MRGRRQCPVCTYGDTSGLVAIANDMRKIPGFGDVIQARCGCRRCGAIWDETAWPDGTYTNSLIERRLKLT